MSTEAEVLEFPIVPRRGIVVSLLPALVASALTGVALFSLIASDKGVGADEVGGLAFLSALCGLAVGMAIFFASRQAQGPGVLRIEPGRIVWRHRAVPGGEVALPYEEIFAAYKHGREGREILVLKGREKVPIMIGAPSFPEARMADSVLETVRERIGRLPDGPQRLAALVSSPPVVERAGFEKKAATPIVSAILIVVFLAELVTGALSDPFRLWSFGANSYPLVKNGELFRLATANLLHGSVPHILFNLLALLNLGLFLEPLLGRWRFLSLFLVSALAGAASSAFVGHHVLALGASTGIAGLIGVYVLILWRWPHRLPRRPTKWNWIWLALSLLYPSLVFDNIDNMAHLGGFLAGFVLMFLETYNTDLPEIANRRRGLFRTTAALLAALFLIASGMAIRRAMEHGSELKTASILLSDASVPTEMLNEIAWEVAASPAASRDLLARALQAVERAVASNPKQAEFRDTRATVLYRLGREEEAIRIELELIAASRKPLYLSQLARFERAAAKARGPLLFGEPLPVPPRVQIESGTSLLVDVGDPHPIAGTVLHFVLANGNKASALLELTAGASEPTGRLRYPLPQDGSLPRPDEVSLTLVDTRKLEGPVNDSHWSLQPVVPEAAGLP
jgi:membrane associated rhomboid family serine protease